MTLEKVPLKGRLVHRCSTIGLCILVTIPFPETVAWTGALVAAISDMRLRDAELVIFLGICIAARIMPTVTFGLFYIL